MTLIEQFEMVVKEYHEADRRFQEARQEYVDAAVYALNEKEHMLQVLLEQIKKEPCLAPVDSSTTTFIRKYLNMLGGKTQ